MTEKRNHTWCEFGNDSSLGVKGGTGLQDLDSGDRMHKKIIIPMLNHRIHTTLNNKFINAEKNQPKYTECSKSDFFVRIY